MSGRSSGARAEAPATAGSLFAMVRAGTATTRQTIARASRLAPSTVSLRVEALIAAGLLEEAGSDTSTRGRQPRLLRVRGDAGTVVAASLGIHHVTVQCADLLGEPIATIEAPIDIADGPQAVLGHVWKVALQQIEKAGRSAHDVLGLVVGVPAPVDPRLGGISSSAQLPGWDHVSLRDLLQQIAGARVRVLVENDANLLAIAEQRLAGPDRPHLLAVKVGSRIGSGIISNGQLHRGASGAGGEMSHQPTAGESTIHCACGAPNCLESVAGGSAIVARLRSEGYELESTDDLVALASTGDARATQVLRESGTLVGEALAGVVNLLNPDLVVFGGRLSTVTVFVAAVRGVLFQRCLPIVTDVLDVRVGAAGSDAEVRGGTQLLLDTILTAEEVDQALALAQDA